MKKLVVFCGVIFLLLLSGALFIFRSSAISEQIYPTHFFSQDNNGLLSNGSPLVQTKPLIVYGYLPYWTRGRATFPETITHVSYFSLGIQADGKILDIPSKVQEAGYRSYQKGALSSLRETITKDQKLELTLTMMDQEAIPLFLKNPTSQDVFLDDLQKIISQQPIDGVNIDIEYNGIVDTALQENLTTLLHRTNILLKKHSPPLHLSIATYSDAGSLQRLTNLKTIAPEVDHIIMMAYDFHRSKSPNAGPNSPIYGKTAGKWGEDIMSDLQLYSQYVPSEKILLGIPFYGYAWSVEDPKNPNSFTLPKSGESVPYDNVLALLSRANVERNWDSEALSPYLRYTVGKNTKILYYDDPQSLHYKMLLVRQANLGGIAIWALGYDGDNKSLWDSIK